RRIVHPHYFAGMSDENTGVVLERNRAKVLAHLLFAAHQNDARIGPLLQKARSRWHSDLRAMISAHAVQSDRDAHQADAFGGRIWRFPREILQRCTALRSPMWWVTLLAQPMSARRPSSVFPRLYDLLAAVVS